MWWLAVVVPWVFSPSLPAGEVAAMGVGGPICMLTLALGLDVHSFPWGPGSFSGYVPKITIM